MELHELNLKWSLLESEKKEGIQSIRIDSKAQPDLFVGINQDLNRNLILKLPANYIADFQSSVKQNLSLELYEETRWVILTLLDKQYIDLFDDLIYSIYNKVKDMSLASDYMSEFLKTYYKWSEFFQENIGNNLSEESVRGLFGELVFLHEELNAYDSFLINDILNSWKGPYDTGHDFVGELKNREVKTKIEGSGTIRISSEYQLQNEPGKEIELVVITIRPDHSGYSLKDIILLIRELVINKLGDYTILLKALAQKGLTLKNLDDYDHLKYTPEELAVYDCDEEIFPKLIRQTLPDAISSLSYKLNIQSIQPFLISTKQLAWK